MLPRTTWEMEELEAAVASYEFELAMDGAAQALLAARGLDEAVLAGSRLGVVSSDAPMEHRPYAGWLAIPYLDKDGRPLTVRFRCIEHEAQGGCKAAGHRMKYASLPHDPARTYGISAIHRAAHSPLGQMHICEGELDSLVLNRWLGLEAIALPGASLWRPRHRIMLDGFNQVFAWVDADAAGDQMWAKVRDALGRKVRRVPIPEGHDVTTVWQDNGTEGLTALWEEVQ